MPIEQRAKDMWVSDLVKEIKKLRKENEYLKVRVDNLQPNYDNRYNLINREREDHQKVVNRLLINNFILILAVVANLIVLLIK